MPSPVPDQRFRFGDFTLDLAAYRLHRGERAVKLERQPMDLLILLVERRGHLVSRAEIADRLWGADVFVDVETGVNTAVRKVRLALGDSPDAPAFVETVSGKGYRFIAAVQANQPPEASAAPRRPVDAPRPVPGGASDARTVEPQTVDPARRRRSRSRWTIGVGVAVVLVLGVMAWALWPRGVPSYPLTLAVLPCDNLGREAGRDYLADGLTEEISHSLALIDPARVRVIGRTSTMAYKGTSKTLAEIGRELGADYFVECSVRAEATRVRIATRLIRASDQVQIWSEAYDRTPGSLLGLQSELSADIAARVRLRLTPEHSAAVARRQPRQPEAYDLYLRGRFFHNQLTPATVERGLHYYRQAVEADPGYALAWAGTALALAAQPINSDVPPGSVVERARSAAERAVATAPDLSEAQVAVGHVAFWLDWQWPAAERALRRATELDPSSAIAHVVLGHTLSQMRRHEEARLHLERARHLDPLYALTHALSSHIEFQAGDLDAALRHARNAIAIDPEFWIGYMHQGQAMLQLGLIEDALTAFMQASRFSAGNSKALSHRGYALAVAGRPDEARQVLQTLLALAEDRYVPPYAIALVHAGLGEADEAFEWLEKAHAVRDVHLIFLPVDPKWARYREDARFVTLLQRCGFEQS
jgi:TolB-like protein/DNA-binding winged helix-turn-helix (wHTH) protein/tetratricopeptide (TPR) repeat protein